MPVDTPHPAYAANIDTWTKARDCFAGEDAIKAAGLRYLRRVEGMTGDEFGSYVDRAVWFSAFARTVQGCVGAIARRDHRLSFPEAMAHLLEDVTGTGVSLAEFVKLLASETLITGRTGILVDLDDQTQRPTLAAYQAESVVGWSPDHVVLRESVMTPDPADRFRLVETAQFRELRMVDGILTVAVWRQKEPGTFGSEWVVYSECTPTRRGVPLDAMPFVWLSVLGRTSSVVAPPLLSLASTSLNYWKTSANLQHGRYFTGMPTLVVTGAEIDEPVRVGAASAVVLKSADAKVYYAEFSGQGLGSLERGLEEIVQQLALLGASAFGGPQRQAETAEAARIRAGAETSILTAVVDAVQDSLSAALRFAGWWQGCADVPTIELNREFHSVKLDPALLTGMVTALQAGAVTPETFSLMLAGAEMLPVPEVPATIAA